LRNKIGLEKVLFFWIFFWIFCEKIRFGNGGYHQKTGSVAWGLTWLNKYFSDVTFFENFLSIFFLKEIILKLPDSIDKAVWSNICFLGKFWKFWGLCRWCFPYIILNPNLIFVDFFKKIRITKENTSFSIFSLTLFLERRDFYTKFPLIIFYAKILFLKLFLRQNFVP